MSAKRLPKVGEFWVNGDGERIGPLKHHDDPVFKLIGKRFNRESYDVFTENGGFISTDAPNPLNLIAPWTDWQAEYERAKEIIDDLYATGAVDHAPSTIQSNVREFLGISPPPDPQDDLCQRADYESKLSREQ